MKEHKNLPILFVILLLSVVILGSSYSMAATYIPPVIDPADLNPIICGDTELETGEECDDGNTTNGDGCNSTCNLEYCGDGIVNNGGTEQCDDGNTTTGDGCTSGCVIESGSGPTGNPPSANVSPTFYDVNVERDMEIGRDLTVTDDLFVEDNALFRNDGAVSFLGPVLFASPTLDEINFMTGLISWGSVTTVAPAQIGSFYTVYKSRDVTNTGPIYETADCFDNDMLSGCSAQFAHNSGNDQYLGAYPVGDVRCKAKASDGGGVDDVLVVYARCFDPQGSLTGLHTNP